MNKIYFLFLALYSTVSYPQSSSLFNETWYLEKLIINEVDNFPPVNATLPYVALEFSEENSILTSVCNIGFGDATFPENGIFLIDVFNVTLSFCLDNSNNLFDSLYLGGYFQNNYPTQYSYTILIGENGLKQLTITNSQNNKAIYYNQNLNISSFEKNKWSIYPNPTKDILYFKNESIQKSNVEIYDVLGKRCIKKTIDTNNNSITTEGLTKGVYLIKIFNDQQTFSSKFIKE